MTKRITDTSIFKGIVEFTANGHDYRAELTPGVSRRQVQIIPVYSREVGSRSYEFQKRVVCRGNATAIWAALSK